MINLIRSGSLYSGVPYAYAAVATPAELSQALACRAVRPGPPPRPTWPGLERLGSVGLLRLELANWLLGAASMQVLMAQDAAIEGEVEAACITLASQRMLSGANCDDDHSKVMFAALLAQTARTPADGAGHRLPQGPCADADGHPPGVAGGQSSGRAACGPVQTTSPAPTPACSSNRTGTYAKP